MSWTVSVPPTPKADFDAAVDAAPATGQDITLPGVAEDVAVAKEALKSFGRRVKRENVAGSANGHSLQLEEGNGWSDSVSANAWGSGERLI